MSTSFSPTAQQKHSRVRRQLFLLLTDLLAGGISLLLSLLLYREAPLTALPALMAEYSPWIRLYLCFGMPLTLLVFYVFRLYNSVWTFAGLTEMICALLACLLTTGVQFTALQLLGPRVIGPVPLTLSYFILYLFFLLGFVIAVRFFYRFLRLIRHRHHVRQEATRVIVYGAGEAGALLLREIRRSNRADYRVVCLLDDNVGKWGVYLSGYRIIGGRECLLAAVKKYRAEEIFLAMPSAPAQEIRAILDLCKQTDCRIKILPGLYQFLNEEVSVAKLRPVEIEDLLGRDPIRVNLTEICGYLCDRVVLVTGGGGSIGSELCRQIARQQPRQLIIFDIYENNAYAIQLELRQQFPELNLVTLIGSVRNETRVRDLFATYRPDIVYHAAAHKHVPLMEDSPGEAVKNNVDGTYHVAKAAGDFGTRRFVLISTDKAVNPTNVMGASKRLCEMIVQMLNGHYPETEFAAVRFGNVLGSNGSVIPLFRRQIEAGGPVTVTHPDIIRYFMTIPEAVSLVLQAGAYAQGGEIFVLDMGAPVKIDTLARTLIRLSGYRPDVDIRIEYTGLRPGEKLYEELLMKEEGLKETANSLIHIGKPLEFDEEQLRAGLMELTETAYREESVLPLIEKLVPTYHRQPHQIPLPAL